MKEANIRINADTADAEANLARLATAADKTSQQMLGVADTAFTIAETMTGSFAIATGAIGLFAGENENFQKIAVKAQSAIALAIGVRQLAEQKANVTTLAGTALTKLNAVATKMAAAVYRSMGIAVKGTALSMKVLKAAIVSTGVGALVVGLGMLVEKLMSATDETDDLADAQDKLNQKIEEGLTSHKKQISLNEQLAKADSEAEKALIMRKIAYEESKNELERLNLEKEREATANTTLSEHVYYDINGNPYTQSVEPITSASEALNEYIGELDEEYKAILRTEEALNKSNSNNKNRTKDKTGETAEVKKLTELEKAMIIDETFLRENVMKGLMSEHQMKVDMMESEIFMMKHKLETAVLTADEEFLLEEDIARKKIELQKTVNEENLRLSEEKAENEQTIKDQQDEADDIAIQKKIDDAQQLQDARTQMMDATASALSNLGALFEEGSKQQKALALVEIAINTGIGFMNGLRIAQSSAAAMGPGAAYAFPIFYATQIAAVLGAAAQAKQIIQSGSESGGDPGGGGGITYVSYVPESAAQGGTPQTDNEEGQPLQAYVVSSQMTNAQALDEELELQAKL